MLTQLLFSGVGGVRVDRLWREGARLHIVVTTTRKRARCPCCGRWARRVQSRYVRTVADVPCGGTTARLQLRARRFWCRVRWCRRRIFCERLPDLVGAWARRTVRLQEHLRREAFALGGEPGARRARGVVLMLLLMSSAVASRCWRGKEGPNEPEARGGAGEVSRAAASGQAGGPVRREGVARWA